MTDDDQKSPAFSFYVRDFAMGKTAQILHAKAQQNIEQTSSKHSSKTQATDPRLLARGLNAYLYLLCAAWMEEPRATLPDDDDELCILARVTMPEWEAIKPILMTAWEKDALTGRWVNDRLMRESKKQLARKQNGSKGGSKTQANRQANLQLALENANENENAQENGSSNRRFHDSAADVLKCLNEHSGRSFRESEASLAPISARLSEAGVEIDRVKRMIVRQCSLWKNDPKMEEYLRPSTLFRKTNFENYYGSADVPVNGVAKAASDETF